MASLPLATWFLAAVSAASDGDAVGLLHVIRSLIAASVFTILGLFIFAVSVWIISRCLPFSLRKEIEEDQNVAVGVIIGAMLIGIAIIIAASLMG